MPKRLMVVLLALFATAVIATQAMAAEDENPLEPLDASSPRATIESFVEQARVVEKAALAYRGNRSWETQRAYLDEVAKTRELSDVSEVSAASLDEVVEENFAALADILMRIPLPEQGSIPMRTWSRRTSCHSGHCRAPRSP